MKINVNVLLPLPLMTVAVGCGSASVRVAFDNSTGSALYKSDKDDETALDYLGIKLLAAYLSEDVNPETFSNQGQTAAVYINPECQDDLAGCDVQAGDGIQHIVQSYFDFSRTTDLVNQQLNAQERELQAGTYRWVRIEWCKWSDHANTFKYRATDMPKGDFHEFNWGGCATSVELDPPLSVGPGDAVTVTLSYDLAQAVRKETSRDGCEGRDASCFADNDSLWFINGPIEFLPNATLQIAENQ